MSEGDFRPYPLEEPTSGDMRVSRVMPADPRAQKQMRLATARALKFGTPYLHQSGPTVYLATQLDHLNAKARLEIKEFDSAGAAREFVRRAVSERGWKTVEAV
jgi:hypothetical protein